MSEEAEAMVRMLADAPEAQRRAVMAERFKTIASQSEDQKVDAVKGLVLAISKLDDKKRMEFIKSRTEVVAEFPIDVRNALQTARVKAGGEIPEKVNMSDMMSMMQAIHEWPEEKRKMFKENLGGVFKELGMRAHVDMMQTVAKTREEMKKPQWKYW